MPVNYQLHTDSILNAITTTPIIVTNDKGVVVFFNKGAEIQLGYKVEEVIDHYNLIDLVLGIDLQTLALDCGVKDTPSFEVLADLVQPQKPLIRQITFIAKDEDLWNCQMTMSRDEAGHYVVLLQDMQKVAIQKNDFAANRKFLEGILKTTPDILYVYDVQEQHLVYSNRNYGEFGHEQAPFLRLNEIKDLIHPEDYPRLKAYREDLKHLQKGQIEFIEYRIKNDVGGYSWLFTKDVVFNQDANGEVKQVLGLARDITEIKETNQKLVQSEALYRAVINAQQEIICRFLPDTTLTFVNEAYCKFFGKTKEELLGTQFLAIVPPENQPEILEQLQAIAEKKQPFTQEYKVLREQQTQDTWIRWTDYPIFDEGGRLKEYQSVGIEITERKQVEIELQEQKQMLEKILNTLPIHVFIKDESGRLIFINQVMLDFFKGKAEQFIGKTDYDIFPKALADKFHEEDLFVRQGGVPDNWEEQVDTEGDLRFFRTGKRLIPLPLQSTSHLLGYSFDITPLKETQLQLKESEAKFRLIANNTKDLICLHTYDAKFNYLSPAIEGLTGHTVSELLHQDVIQWVHEEDRKSSMKVWREMLKTKTPKVVEYRFRHKQGHWVWVESHLFPVYAEDGTLRHVQVNTRNVTERKESENVLKQSRDYLIKVLEHIPDPVFVKNEQYQFISVNDAYCELVGKTRDEILHHTDFEVFIKEDAEVFRNKDQQALQKGALEEFQWVIRNAHNEQRTILARVDIFRDDKNQQVLVGVIRDVTNQKVAEEQLAYNERSMKAILTSFNDVVFEINQDLIFTNFWGDSQQLIFSEQDFLGKKVTEVFDDPMRSYFTSSLRYVLDNKTTKTIEYPAIQKGKKNWYSCTINYLPETPDREVGVSVLVSDVTPYKSAQQKLRESEEQLQDFLDNASLLIQSVDFDGNIQYVNRYWCKKLGYSKAEALRTNLLDVISPDERDEYLQFLTKLKREGGAHQFNVSFITKEGNTLMLEGSINIRTGRKPLLRSFLHDVTERNQAEKAILEQNRLFEAFLENSPIGIQIFDQAGNSLQMNDAQRNILGLPQENDDQMDFNILEDRMAQEAGLDFFYKSAFGGESIFLPRLETTLTTYDSSGKSANKDVCLNLIIFPIKNEQDGVQGVVTFTQDVSEQFSIERELNESRYFIKSIADAIPNDVYVYDLEKEKYVYTNTQYFKYSGFTVKDIDRGGLNKVWSLIHPEDVEDVKIIFEEVYKGGEDMYEMVYRLACNPFSGRDRRQNQEQEAALELHQGNQRYVWVYDRIVPFKINVEGRVTQILGVVQNITDNKNFEEQLIQAKQDAEEALRAKELFLSTMSHEIRTPMNAVIGITHLLLQESPKTEQLENLNTLKFSSENLLNLINDILDYNKIEAGKLSFEEIDFNLREFINNVKQGFAYQADEKGIELEFYIDHSVPNILIGDPIRLNQILTNLLSNAIKFTDKGFVVVKIRLHKEQTKENNKVTVLFSVKDTGIGISSEKIAKIFDRFTQADSDTTRRFGGTGLGLAITKYLIEHQGGGIKVQSEVDKGSEFVFHLDFEISKLKQLEGLVADNEGDAQVHLTNVDLLLVEDRKINRMVASKFLRRWGITVDFAFNGLEAVEKVKQKQYDIILMDLLMPKMDGFEATRNIRQMDAYQSTPIIALSASTLNQEREKAKQVKMNDFVAKPFNPNELYHKIMKYTKQNEELVAELQTDLPQTEAASDQFFDLTKLEEICAGDQEMREELVRIFADELSPAIENFKAAALSYEPEPMRIVVHNLRSSTELFGTTKLLEALQEARELSLNRANLQIIEPLLQNIDVIKDQIVEGLYREISS
ncbi:hypothetical protein BKI52_30975 [marine bacterium AO1-C]|nr:hypothetical protein BKI52_30975 [marine bacterium AO1-C]